MDTAVVVLEILVPIRRAWANSSAVEESRPRVELRDKNQEHDEDDTKWGGVLVPTINQASARPSFRNRNSFLLTARDATNPGIANKGLPHMTKSENGGEDVSDGFNVVVPALTIRSCVWGTSLGGEPNGFLDGEGREMDVVLGGVLDVTAIMGGDLLGGQGTEVDISLDVVVGTPLVREHLEECRASRPWAPQHDWVMCVSLSSERSRDQQTDSRSISPGLTTPLKSWRIVLVDGGRNELLHVSQMTFGLNIDPTVS